MTVKWALYLTLTDWKLIELALDREVSRTSSNSSNFDKLVEMQSIVSHHVQGIEEIE